MDRSIDDTVPVSLPMTHVLLDNPPLEGVPLRSTESLTALFADDEVVPIVVAGGRGWGKTRLMRSWFDELRLPSREGIVPSAAAWVTVTSADDDPARFSRRLNEALETKPRVIFVDDLDHISSTESLGIVSHLLGSDTSTRVVVGLRRRSCLPLSGLRARGGVIEFEEPQLAVSAGEVESWAGAMQLDVPSAVLQTVVELAAGWALGVQRFLAGLAAAEASVEATLTAVSDELGLLLEEDANDHLDADDLEFLLCTSILERLTAANCDAATGATGSLDRLVRLRDVCVVQSLDRNDHAFHLHPLHRRRLQTRLLASESTEETATRHVRVARSLDRDRHPESVIGHYLAAGEAMLAADALATLWAHSPSAATPELLALFDDLELEDHPPHILTRAIIESEHGDHAGLAQAISRLETSEWSGPLPHGIRTVEAAIAGLRCRLPTVTEAELRADVEALRLNGADVAGQFQQVAQSVTAFRLYLLADLGEAVTFATAALDGHRAIGRTRAHEQTATVIASDLLAIIDNDFGRRDSARAGRSRSLGLLEQYGFPTFGPLFADIHGLAGAVVSGEPPLVRLEHLEQLAESARSSDIRAFATLESVRLLDQLDRPDDASMMLGRAEELIRVDSSQPLLHDRLSRLQTALGPTSDRRTGPRPAITMGERAVLRLLPGDLSQTDMSAALGLSVNTVKSHVRSIYLKLGVDNRHDAVSAAGRLGLLTTWLPWQHPAVIGVERG